jgi:AraC family transcriptional regulator
MVQYRLVDRPAFEVAGRTTYISGPDNAQFGRFWEICQAEGLFARFEQLTGMRPGPQTGGITLGVSRVEKDPVRRDFAYMIAVEVSPGTTVADGSGVPNAKALESLEVFLIPACRWAVFECRGRIPEALVAAEIYAFREWLPASGYTHALAPEMEVYPPAPRQENGATFCEFWLPVVQTPEHM